MNKLFFNALYSKDGATKAPCVPYNEKEFKEMKVLFINLSSEGHHLDYLKALTKIDRITPIIIQKEKCNEIDAEQLIIEDIPFGSLNLRTHLRWITRVKKLCIQVKPDIIHFVWGDSFYRFFGLGFNWIKNYNSVITFHQVRKSNLHRYSILRYGKLFKCVVVHTESLQKELNEYGLKNVAQIEYPNFRAMSQVTKLEAKKKLGIKTSKKILLCLGGTRRDKGLDLLMKALEEVKTPFFLLIAGGEQNIKLDDIKEGTIKYRDNTHVLLRYLSDEEIDCCLSCSDYVVLPYRLVFDGASGPLAEGVGYGKCIIGSEHGSLGRLIKKHHIGRCFQSENIHDMARVIDLVLQEDFVYDEIANQYRITLYVNSFQNKYREIYADIYK